MKREWKTGDVAMVTMPDGSEHVCHRESAAWRELYTCQLHPDPLLRRVLPARPLVVIDPENHQQVMVLTLLYCAAKSPEASVEEAMQAALRDLADPKPPKPEEPTGLGAVVVDRAGRRWCRWSDDADQTDQPWSSPDIDVPDSDYAGIDAVEVLSQGVTP